MGIALFHREKTITDDIYRTIVSVAKDTAPDRVEEIVKQLALRAGDEYVSTKKVCEWTRFPSNTTSHVLQDLALLHVVQREPGRTQGFWRLSSSMQKLMRPLGLYEEEHQWKRAKKSAKRRKRRKR
jgi:hypothetical protein